MMEEQVLKDLNQEKVSDFHKSMLDHCLNLVSLSRKQMHKKYMDWDRFDKTYRGERLQDVEDQKAANRQEPTKMVVPIAYAQIQTYVAFCISLYTQRELFYELLGMSPEDEAAAKLGEALLQRDLDYNKFVTKLYQFLLDTGRFGVGVMKCYWTEEKQSVQQVVEKEPVKFLGLSIRKGETKTTTVQQTKFQGNKVVNISPYKFFPDPRLPLSRFQEGEFIGSEDEYSYPDLKGMEKAGVIAGLDYVKEMSVSTDNVDRKNYGRFNDVEFANSPELAKTVVNGKRNIVITEVQVKIVPSQYHVTTSKVLGKEDSPVKYLVWIANDNRIVRCEPMNYVHDEYTYAIGEYSPDMNHFLNHGISETIEALQEVITWFINSHITSVRKVIQNYLIVDPKGVEMDDLKQRRPVIRLKGEGARLGIDRWVKQLQVNDVTSQHMGDADTLQGVVQVVTGINENLLGQFHSGRRSATEARNVSSSAAARLKTVASLLWASALEPMGRQMLSNLRDGLTVETYVKMFKSSSDPVNFMSFKKVSKKDLVGNYDFSVFDGTLPSEKGFIADSLKEILMELLANPVSVQMLGLDPKIMMFEYMRLKGIRHPQRFAIQVTPEQAQLMQQQNAQQQSAGGQPGVSGAAGQQATGTPGPMDAASMLPSFS